MVDKGERERGSLKYETTTERRSERKLAHARLVWTNEEGGEGAVTTVSFEEKGSETVVVVHDLYPSKEELDAAIASGSTGAFPEQFEELDALLTMQQTDA